jgi:hypothetical protein
MKILDMPILQVAIAVIISWALFAIFVSLVQECFAQILGERGRFMKAYLLKQLKDVPNSINWALLVYQHGAVDLLIRETNKPTNDIDPRLFAEVLVEVVGKTHSAEINKQTTGFSDPSLDRFKSAVQTFEESDVMSFLNLAMKNAELKTPANGKVNESEVYEKLIEQIESWYGKLMERLTLWYKKRMRQKLFIFGFVISVIINVDSIQLFNFYRLHPESTGAIEHYYKNYLSPADTASATEERSRLLDQTTIRLDSLAKSIDLPVGFDYSIFKERHAATGWWWLWKLIGFIITGFAVSFGAPFWFDVLKNAYTKKNK